MMKFSRRQHLIALAILNLIAIMIAPKFLISLNVESEQKRQVSIDLQQVRKINESDAAALIAPDLRESFVKMTKDLTRAKSHIRGLKADGYLKAALLEMNKILDNLQILPEDIQISNENNSTSMCSEIYKGTYYGQPVFYKGFEADNCSHQKSLSSLLTIILPNCEIKDKHEWDLYHNIIEEIKAIYGNVTIIIGFKIPVNSSDEIKRLPTYVKSKIFQSSATLGTMLNSHLGEVRSNFTLIARDLIHVNEDSRLERLIREIERLNIAVAGGASRDQNGQWRQGCYQRGLRNFNFVLTEGYDVSLHECLFCDHIDASFIIKTDTAKKISFDETITGFGVFEDFFLRLGQGGYSSVVCPDAMFFKNRTVQRDGALWRSFAKKWNIHDINISHDIHIEFSCDDFKSGTRCDKTVGYALHPCCRKKLSNMIKFVLRYCNSQNITCELQEGTLLGVLKFNTILPWERDGDLTFLPSNFSALLKMADSAKKLGYNVRAGKKPWRCTDKEAPCGEVYIRSDHWELEMYGRNIVDSELMSKAGMKPTTVLFDGEWVNVPRNPGLHSRNRYGHEIYAHAEHWRTLGGKTGWINYKSRQFTKCKEPNRHDCLDQYNGDGNIQFKTMFP